MKNVNALVRSMLLWPLALVALLALSACGSDLSTTIGTQPQPTTTVNAGFQSQVTPLPTIPPYRCGTWTSNNAPNPGATLLIYARLTHNLQGVQGMQATATVHFQGGDVTLDQQASDQGGYVTFTLQLQDQQPANVPATVDVTFTNVPGGNQTCETFFTPV
jgi:hypothetical protein